MIKLNRSSATTESNPRVAYFHIPRDSINDLVRTWQIARSADDTDEVLRKINMMLPTEKDKLAGEVLAQDIPPREFIPVYMVIDGVARAFQEQMDRHRVGFSFWEQSLRQKNLVDDWSVYVPKHISSNHKLRDAYLKDMESIHKIYNRWTQKGPLEDARGFVPLHISVRFSVQCNLRSLIPLITKRSCYHAQGSMWSPIIMDIMNNLWRYFPSLKESRIAPLPCEKVGFCPYEKDQLDRLEDESNPICPVLISDYGRNIEPQAIFSEMVSRYPDYVEESNKYAKSVGVNLDPELFGNVDNKE